MNIISYIKKIALLFTFSTLVFSGTMLTTPTYAADSCKVTLWCMVNPWTCLGGIDCGSIATQGECDATTWCKWR